jgi:hydrogenase nickel incorporation protein HypB
MCATCGCGDDRHLADPDQLHEHEHGHEHHDHEHHEHSEPGHEHHRHDDDGARGRLLRLERDVLEKNDRAAERNRGYFAAREVLALNLVSAPGSGKTTLLERTVRESGLPICVIEGDQATARDADRIRAAGARALQINTGSGCHLDAEMIERSMPRLRPEPGSVLVIENVGNLVCPALFDLGERAKVLVTSVTEGDDKPLKYPHMFRAASLVLLNKVDLLPHVPFEVDRFIRAVGEVNPGAGILQVSALRGDGLPSWFDWLRRSTARATPASQKRASTEASGPE